MLRGGALVKRRILSSRTKLWEQGVFHIEAQTVNRESTMAKFRGDGLGGGV